MNRLRAKKRLGQHFLTDVHVASHIIEAVAPEPKDTIVEIGPGRGALTSLLVQTPCQIEAVEIDADLIEYLQRRFGQYKSLRLHHQDALQFDFSSPHNNARTRIVGNLPYNISTPLLIRLFDACEHILDMHLMLQTEVAERLVARPGSRNYSRLSVTAACFVKAQRLFDVAPEAFSPPPQVNSSIVRLTPHPHIIKKNKRKAFSDLVRKAFSQRRKTLGKIFADTFNDDDFAQMRIQPNTRPQELDAKHFLVMLDLFSRKLNDSTEAK